eukprot:scaffold19238_cov63-Phaeocystis_antarctica.AAC.3
MLSPTSLAAAPDKMVMTRPIPLASSTTLPATSASMVTARLMQSVESPRARSEHMLSGAANS